MLLKLLFETNIVVVTGILGGYDIDIKDAPYQVNYGDICGGVLIHPIWAMTTAHCGTDPDFIRIGNKHRLRGARVKVRKHIVHPQFGKKHEFDYDIQLLKLQRSLPFNKYVQGIPISRGQYGESIFIAGWGYLREKGDYNDVLQEVQLRLVPFEHCQRINNQWYNNTLTTRMFCAGGGQRDACQGDSGGPAVSFGQLVGLSSFGFGCGRAYPGVFTNVTETNIRTWIRKYTGI